MSVAASRWAINYLLDHPAPHDGGLSPDARAVLLVLAAHAGYPPNGVGAHVATVSAPTIAAVLGRHHRTVRPWLQELEARSVVPVIRPRGKAARWHFLVPPMSTPMARTPGVALSTPMADSARTHGARAIRRDEGDVLTDTYAISRGVER